MFMNIKTYLQNISIDYSKFDELYDKNIEQMDISSIFKLEKNIRNNIYNLENSNKDLDIIYLNYQTIKSNIKNKIRSEKNILIKLDNNKDNYNKDNLRQKLLFLTKEYNFLIEQTNTKLLVEKIETLESKIQILMDGIDDKNILSKYDKVKKQYNKIVIFTNSEKFGKKDDIVPNNVDITQKIEWYREEIETLLEKQMIFDKYIYLLENFYSDLLEKRMLDFTSC